MEYISSAARKLPWVVSIAVGGFQPEPRAGGGFTATGIHALVHPPSRRAKRLERRQGLNHSVGILRRGGGSRLERKARVGNHIPL